MVPNFEGFVVKVYRTCIFQDFTKMVPDINSLLKYKENKVHLCPPLVFKKRKMRLSLGGLEILTNSSRNMSTMKLRGELIRINLESLDT